MTSLITRSSIFNGLFFLLFATLTQAEILTLPSTQEVTVEAYGDENAKHHILWMHSEWGISGDLQKTLLSISKKQSIQIHLPDWLDSYFIPRSRSSLDKIPQQDFEDLMSHYSKDNKEKLIIVASGRATSVVLNAVHHLQTLGGNDIAGLIFISPYLRKPPLEIGKQLEYQEIAAYSNLPLYVFQPERSPRFVPLPHLIAALEKGGSPVYTHILDDISGGFHAREVADLTKKDMQAREDFPKQIANALSMLAISEKAPLKKINAYTKTKRKKKADRFQKVTQAISKTMPELDLKDLQGKAHKLSDYKGKALLISFWASWCRPCLDEMPSLVKLKEKYKDKLEILAVNVREKKATIEKFTHTMNINFPLLQDLESSTVEDWKVYVYPSNFLIDSKGKLRYAATGAMDWQESKWEKVIESLWK